MPDQDTSITALVRRARADAQRLLSAQLELARLEVQEAGRSAGRAGILLIGALTLAGLAGIFVLVTLAYALVALGLPVWAGFGIVALLLAVVAGVLFALGRSSAKGISRPGLAAAELERTRRALSGSPDHG